jgi:maleate cis-trans isomerase
VYDLMLGNSKTLKIHVLTSRLDKYEERLRDFLQNNNFEIIDIKICNVGPDISVLIIYRDLVQHPFNLKKGL